MKNFFNRYIKQPFRAIVTATAIMAVCSATAQELPQTYFPYPSIPENLTTLSERTGYLVEHFWERCNFKNAFSSKSGMAQAFSDYLSFLPHAPLETVNQSIDKLLKELKKNPEGLDFIVDRAGDELYSDSAQYWSDEIYLKFLKAGVANKKTAKEKKQRYEKLISQLSGSQVGMMVPDVTISLANGSKSKLRDIVASDTASITLLYLFDPTDKNASLDRLRVDADSRINSFIDDGNMKVVAIAPMAPTAETTSSLTSYPSRWTVGASDEADRLFDHRAFPSFYILDRQGIIRYKNLVIDDMLYLLYQM